MDPVNLLVKKSSFLTYYVIKYMNKKSGKYELFDIVVNSKNDKNKSLTSLL